MYSVKLIDTHFWMHTIGVVFYIASMWIAGVMQGLMWRATNADGTLTYTFVESLNATYPYYLAACRRRAGADRHAADGLQRGGRPGSWRRAPVQYPVRRASSRA
jgi:hypothetical protein